MPQTKIGWIILLVADTENEPDKVKLPCPIVIDTGIDGTPIVYDNEEECIKDCNDMRHGYPSCTYVVAQVEWSE